MKKQEATQAASAAHASAARLSADALDFVPGLLAIQESPPARLPRTVMHAVMTLFVILLAWSIFGKLDVVASAEGRLVPQTYVKIVQPADAGIVQQILVKEGEQVQAGQVLMRMDPQVALADEKTIRSELALKSLQLRRIDAEMSGTSLVRNSDDPASLFQQVQAQYQERRLAYQDSLGQAQAAHRKAERDADAGREALQKLRKVTPILEQQTQSLTDLEKDGYVPRSKLQDKQREYVTSAQDLKAQEASVESLNAAVAAAVRQEAQITSKYRSDLQNERVEAEGQYQKLQQELAKQEHKSGLLELRAPQAGIVKDVATHTIGTVVQPGTVLLSIVPEREPLVAEVMVRNDDVGFVYAQQKVKVKLAAYPFEQYGMLEGKVIHIGPDASEPQAAKDQGKDSAPAPQQLTYKAIVALDSQELKAQGEKFRLSPGMQVVAEINQGRRTVLEYLLSPVKKTLYDSGRER
jgi:HlyD family secretion protein